MRKPFADFLHEQMGWDTSRCLVTADLGYGLFNQIRLDYPDRFIDVGGAEQLQLGVGTGLALSGLRPVCYSITPFLLYRPFEWLRNFLHTDGVPVKLVGGGRDQDYGTLGSTHWAEDDEAILKCLPNIRVFKPATADPAVFREFLNHTGPAYLNLKK